MVRKFAALLLVTLLSLPACGMTHAPRNSVQALTTAGGRIFCTAFSINEAAGYYGSAAHCAAYALKEGLAVFIDGQPAWVVFVGFPSTDVAVFQTEATAPAFYLSNVAPQVGDAITVTGFAYGITRMVTTGTMAARRIPIIHPSTEYYMTSDILDVTTSGGNSGSPVLDKNGYVINILWGGFTDSAHSLGVSYEGTIQALAPFVSR
jgi:S1-C subfamily serine protease